MVRLGPPLASQTYAVTGATKVVSYWVGRARQRFDVSTYVPNNEIDEVRWVALDKARIQLSYDRDRETLDEAAPFTRKSQPVVLVRHTEFTQLELPR